jgi:putative transposase
MAQDAVRSRNISIRFACQLFAVSESCYRYQAKLNEENDAIADWLLRITDSQRNWGFGLCFLYLRNVKGFRFNHKRGVSNLLRAVIEPADQAQKTPETE